MKITILTFGSRGDVEPYLALAQGLQQSGHQVTIAAPAGYADWIRAHGVVAYPLPIDIVAFLQRPDISGPEKPFGPIRQFLRVKAGLSDLNRRALESFIEACSDTDFILQTGDAHGGVEIADRMGIPMAFAFPFPYAPTRDFPTFFSNNQLSLGGLHNYWTHRVGLSFGWRVYGPPLNRWRAEHFGLPPLRTCIEMLESRRHLGAPTLYAFSSSIVPRPSDWRPTDHITGYWFLEPAADWRPPADLVQFLASGPPPVYVGFGSMPYGTPERNTRTVLRALELSGKRGVLMVGGGGAIARMPASRDVFYLDSVPHGWLFPQMAAVVHHGGAGTTAAVLRSGVPGIVSPITFDQFSWAHYVSKLRVGLRAPQLRRMSPERLAKLIAEAIGDSALRARADALGHTIRAENGVANAVEIIERYAGRFRDVRPAQPPSRIPARFRSTEDETSRMEQETTLESRVRAKLRRFSDLLRARDRAAADELANGGAPLLGSEAHEQYFTRDEIASHLDEIYAKPFLLSFDWKTVRPSRSGSVVWAIVEADMIIDDHGGGRRTMPYRLTAIFEDVDGILQWRLFSGSEPAPPPQSRHLPRDHEATPRWCPGILRTTPSGGRTG